MDTLIWLLKANIAIVLLYVFYKLFFQKDTFFGAKRVILLSSFLFALVYPFFDIKALFTPSENMAINQVVIELPGFLVTNTHESSGILSITNIIFFIWFAGMALFFSNFVVQLISILRKILTSRQTQLMEMKIYIHKGLKTPFSFFYYILIDPELHNEQELSEILYHEATHVGQGHTWDIIFSEFFCILCWFNPFAWLMKKEIRINLEYLADRSVVGVIENTEHYQLHLLRLSYHKAIAQLSNNFNVSPH